MAEDCVWQIFCGEHFWTMIAPTEKAAIRWWASMRPEVKIGTGPHTFKQEDITKVIKCWTPPLCGVRWLREHRHDHEDFVPSIEVSDGKSSFKYRGEIKRGELTKILKREQ